LTWKMKYIVRSKPEDSEVAGTVASKGKIMFCLTAYLYKFRLCKTISSKQENLI
jgi:hypothetical protein